ncbi:FHA domain-containing protein [Ruegeria halocynthiae]|uniref:FHA domain-containing protein n=1 Tax=Ruegeria halocynthiae TaxID=985054 RepID=UPI000560B24E|nr:FHA domain-containing protein [Ruegeria halocynthiae]
MFKYKSPLSRLLEGAGKAKETEAEEIQTPEVEKPEPIADFNALREALAGGNVTSDSYEEAEELIPEDKMPAFSEARDEASVAPADEVVVAEVIAEVQEEPVAETPELEEPEPVVTLHVTEEVDVEEDEIILVETTQAEPEVETAQADPVVEVVTEDPAPEPTPEPQPAAPAAERRGRVKTTFLGFERADTHVQDLIETAEPVAKTEAAPETFPVGWLVVTSGPGRGACVTLTEGLMQIGRNDDQAIQLDFGDTGISRSNHAVIAYDPEDRKCYLGHGGKANLVRLNGKPVLSTIALASGDLIRISETSLRFAAFCDDGFDWRDS